MIARLLAALGLIVATIVGTVLITAAPASACSCVVPSIDFLDTHDVAFSGVVADRRTPGDEAILKVRTDRVFKGEVTQRIDVVGDSSDAACGLEAKSGDQVLVFGSLVDGEVTSNLCLTVSAPGESYSQLLAELGEGAEPTAGYMRVRRGALGLTYEQFLAGRAILGVLGLISLGYIAFQVWRARRRTA